MTSALTLAGLRLSAEEVIALGKGLQTMNILKDSSFYQVILNEGIENGRQEALGQGHRRGRIEGARDVVFRLGRIRFGRLNKTIRAAIEAINGLDRLEHLNERLLTATSWADLLAESE
jgi:predicted transposase YdaD